MWSGIAEYIRFSIAPVLTLRVVLHAGPIVRLGRRPPVVRLRAGATTTQAGRPAAGADRRRHPAHRRSDLDDAGAGAARPAPWRPARCTDDAGGGSLPRLGVEERLNGLPLGLVRHAERLRIECELQYEGLVDPPHVRC